MKLTDNYRFVHNHIATKRPPRYLSYESYDTLCGVNLAAVLETAVRQELDGRKVCKDCLCYWKEIQLKRGGE